MRGMRVLQCGKQEWAVFLMRKEICQCFRCGKKNIALSIGEESTMSVLPEVNRYSRIYNVERRLSVFPYRKEECLWKCQYFSVVERMSVFLKRSDNVSKIAGTMIKLWKQNIIVANVEARMSVEGWCLYGRRNVCGRVASTGKEK